MITPLSSPPSPSAERRHDLHPVLSAALDCLDFELEAELARYQRLTQYQGQLALTEPSQTSEAGSDGSEHGLAIAPAAVTQLDDAEEQRLLQVIDGDEDEAYLMQVAGLEAVPETYLESSEQLLRGLEDLDDDEPRPQRFLSHLFTPLGVGLLLLVSLSTGMLAYVFFNSRSVQVAQRDPSAQSIPGDAEGAPLSPLSPNLTVGEFAKLDLGRLIGLPGFKSAARPNSAAAPLNTDEASSSEVDLNPIAAGDSPPAPRFNTSAPEPVTVVPLGPALPPVQPAPRPTPPRPSRRAAAPSAPAPAPPAASPPVPIAPAAPDAAIAGATESSAAAPTAGTSTAETSPAETSTAETSTAESPQATPRPGSRSAAAQPSAAQSATPQDSTPQDSTPQNSTAAQPSTPQSSATPPSGPQPSGPQPSGSQPSSSQPQTTPQPAASPQPEASSSTAPADGDYHHVVTPYTGDRSLREAREAVSGAYVRNSSEGAEVQLGAFESQSRAEQFVDELAEQGIDATVQP